MRKHLDGHARLDDAVLVVSELVTNAVRHSASGAGGTITVALVGIPGGCASRWPTRARPASAR